MKGHLGPFSVAFAEPCQSHRSLKDEFWLHPRLHPGELRVFSMLVPLCGCLVQGVLEFDSVCLHVFHYFSWIFVCIFWGFILFFGGS
ncbi:hypothetical protein NDU88_002910 [Pleurodeles waltl]|uniref:Uncharacterized protein n=1 Tax=Pleurodeles waltl TaxID=8319 RepID=A0AAV7SEC9_PLEWA|nr:hypothetical protein NDU88_002910 [Pleurodeles waltl]